jgi:hypothetical protein
VCRNTDGSYNSQFLALAIVPVLVTLEETFLLSEQSLLRKSPNEFFLLNIFEHTIASGMRKEKSQENFFFFVIPLSSKIIFSSMNMRLTKRIPSCLSSLFRFILPFEDAV